LEGAEVKDWKGLGVLDITEACAYDLGMVGSNINEITMRADKMRLVVAAIVVLDNVEESTAI